jgi:DNA-binding MurR/RpiR family transcriptional regulator
MSAKEQPRQSRLLAKIESSLATLSPNDRKIADYLLSAFPHGAWATVETVAGDVKVSKAAVIRFSTRLGYDGFAELQREMQQEVAGLFASPLTLLEARVPAREDDVFARGLDRALENLHATRGRGVAAPLIAAADAIAKCKGRVYIIGFRKSYAVAYYARHMLNMIVPNTLLVGHDDSPMPDTLLEVTAKDVVLAISVRRYASATIRALKHCRARGAHVITVSDSIVGPAARVSDSLIVAPCEGVSLFDSAVPIVFYIECIVNAVAAKCRQSAVDRLADAEQLARDFGVFEDTLG